MKTFWKGALAGGAVTAAAMSGYVLGTSAHAQQANRTVSTCQVQVGLGELTVGTQCFSDQVQVGTDNGYLLCSDLTVTCE